MIGSDTAAGLGFTEVGDRQPVRWPRCGHDVATADAKKALEGSRRCPREDCNEVLGPNVQLHDLPVSGPAFNQLGSNGKFESVKTQPDALNGSNLSGQQALAMFNPDGLQLDGSPLPYSVPAIIGPNTYNANKEYILPYKYTPEERERLMKLAQSGVEKLPAKYVETIGIGDIVVAPSTQALMQPLHAGFKRFMVEVVFQMGNAIVDASIFDTRLRLENAGKVPDKEWEHIQAESKAIFEGDITIIKLYEAKPKSRYAQLCARVRMRHEEVMQNALEQASLHCFRTDIALYRGLNKVRADGRHCKLYVCDAIVTAAGGKDMAQLRRVMPANMRDFDGVKRAHRMKVRRGGLAKGPKAQFQQELELLEGTALKNMAKLMFGVDRDDGWVEGLLSADTEGNDDNDSEDEGAPGWRIYDPDDGLESDEDEF